MSLWVKLFCCCSWEQPTKTYRSQMFLNRHKPMAPFSPCAVYKQREAASRHWFHLAMLEHSGHWLYRQLLTICGGMARPSAMLWSHAWLPTWFSHYGGWPSMGTDGQTARSQGQMDSHTTAHLVKTSPSSPHPALVLCLMVSAAVR